MINEAYRDSGLIHLICWIAGWALLPHISAALLARHESFYGSVFSGALSCCQAPWCLLLLHEVGNVSLRPGRLKKKQKTRLWVWHLSGLWHCGSLRSQLAGDLRVWKKGLVFCGNQPKFSPQKQTFHSLVGKWLEYMTTRTFSHINMNRASVISKKWTMLMIIRIKMSCLNCVKVSLPKALLQHCLPTFGFDLIHSIP